MTSWPTAQPRSPCLARPRFRFRARRVFWGFLGFRASYLSEFWGFLGFRVDYLGLVTKFVIGRRRLDGEVFRCSPRHCYLHLLAAMTFAGSRPILMFTDRRLLFVTYLLPPKD